MLDPISAMQVAAEVLVRDGGGGPAKCPFRPMEFNIVVELDPTEEVTKGGIILPNAQVERDKLGAEEGTLIAVSPLAFSYANPSEWGDHEKPKIGDRVMVKRYDGVLREKDGKSYRIVPDKSLVAVIEGDE
jgi:co-chaperonin GroES (HSP10)